MCGLFRVSFQHTGLLTFFSDPALTDLIYSGGWDSTIRAWDLRSPREVGVATLHGKVYAMDLNDDKLVVCDSMKRVRGAPCG